MKRVTLIGIALLMAAGLATAAGDREKTPGQKKLDQKLKDTIIEACDFRDATLKDIIDFLKSISHDKELNIVTGFPLTADTPVITLSLKKIPIGDVIRYVTEIAGLGYRIDDNAVVITRRTPASYRTEAVISPLAESDQYIIDFKIYSVDATGKEDVLSAPKIVVKIGQEGEIMVGNDEKSDGIFCKVIVNEKNGCIEASTRIIIKTNSKDTFNSAQTISLKKK